MTPLPTISDVFRLALEWDTFVGVSPTNIFHVLCTATDNVEDIANAFADAFDDTSSINCFNPMNTNFHCRVISVTPLDGSSSATDITVDNPMDGVATDAVVPQVAAVVNFKTHQRGSRGRGRMYVGPCSEGKITNGLLDSAVVTLMQSNWQAALARMEVGTPSLGPVVASYAHSDAHPITSVTVRAVLGTQRRRQDQLR